MYDPIVEVSLVEIVRDEAAIDVVVNVKTAEFNVVYVVPPSLDCKAM
jgi:hypothetical protein